MGPNGSGKSTLANAIMGHPNLDVTDGQIVFKARTSPRPIPTSAPAWACSWLSSTRVGPRRDRHKVPAHGAQRSPRGPRTGPHPTQGVSPDRRGRDEADQRAKGVLEPLPERGLLGRREEAHGDLQLALQRPELAILDETDSGLDIDALRVVANGVNAVAARTWAC